MGKFRRTISVHTKQGIFTIDCADQGVGRPLYCEREFELGYMVSTIDFLRQRRLLPPKGEGTVLDVGANIGVTSIGMLYLKEFQSAIAVEPEPHNFSLLLRNVKQNGMENRIKCYNYALSDRAGTLEFELSRENYGDHRVMHRAVDKQDLYRESERSSITVKAMTLDELIGDDRPSLIWIDTQGFEGYVYAGGERLLSQGIPIVSEFWPYGIKQAGMSQERFMKIAEKHWSSYWILRRGKFVRYPISVLSSLFEELSFYRHFDNIILTS